MTIAKRRRCRCRRAQVAIAAEQIGGWMGSGDGSAATAGCKKKFKQVPRPKPIEAIAAQLESDRVGTDGSQERSGDPPPSGIFRGRQPASARNAARVRPLEGFYNAEFVTAARIISMTSPGALTKGV
jgi:hypothetical protein